LSWSKTEDDLLALVQGRIGVGVDR
jgi:hypothetical protein